MEQEPSSPVLPSPKTPQNQIVKKKSLSFYILTTFVVLAALGFILFYFTVYSNLENQLSTVTHENQRQQAFPTKSNPAISISPTVKLQPTNSPPLSPTTTSASPLQVTLAQQALAKEAGIDPSTIAVVSANQTEWNDNSLGCPKKGMEYLQVITPGYKIVLRYLGSFYEYHTDMSTRVVKCNSYGSSTDGK